LAQTHSHLRLGIWVRFLGPRLDARLAAGDDPSNTAALARRAEQLVSGRARRRIARGLERVSAARPEQAVFSSAIPCDWRAVELARPVLRQLAEALRAHWAVQAQGVALAHVLLTEPASALYHPASDTELYEVAREALAALGPARTAEQTSTEDKQHRWLRIAQ
jgi:hypothetical protein